MVKKASGTTRVLVTVQEGNRPDLDIIARKLEAAGMSVAERFPLGGVIAGEVSWGDLPKVRDVQGVETVEEEPVFQA